MNRGKYILIIFLIFFILILATCGSLLYLELGRPPSVKTHSYLEIPLAGGIQEKVSPDLLSTLLNIKPPLSLYDIWMNFNKAKVDRRIDSIVLRLNYMECDWGKINELRNCILDFKQSGKKVYAYIDETVEFDKEYFLATACNRIILHPMGTLIINGIGGYIPFFKEALDNLGVKAEVEHIGKYKTAYNMFTESDLIPAHREMLESIYGDIFQLYVKTIAEERNKTENEVRMLIDRGYFQGEQALEAGLVDDLYYLDELQEILSADGTRLSKISHEVYTRIKPSSVGLSGGKKIAIIYGMGPILTGEGVYQAMGSTTVARWFQYARKDRSIAAVIFRVDSPGGSAVASDIIWREVILTKKEKPVVISMSDMAGSGGYWVSMSADKIVAHPQTLTGSIGVIFGKFSFSGLLDKIGITGETITFGKRADIFSPHRELTSEESAFLNQQIQWTYDRFVKKVAEGRTLTEKKVNEIGQGRVWTGSQAKELGLVDEIGGMNLAVKLAKELAGIPSEEPTKFEVWPKTVSFMDMVFGRPTIDSGIGVSFRLQRLIWTLKLLKNDSFWALMPSWIAPE